jgi:uncharacterized protein
MVVRIISNIILALGIAAAGFLVGDGIKYFKRFEKTIEVKGLAERIVKSTQASWKIEFAVSSENVAQLNHEVGRIQGEVKKFLLSKGFEEGEIQRHPVSIRDNMADPYTQKKDLPRYSGRGGLVIGTNKVDLVTRTAEQTDELLKTGVLLEQSNINYFFDELNTIKPQMLQEATAAAREAAASFAAHSGSSLGKIKGASQGLFTISAPFSEFDGVSSFMKKVRVVTQVSYFID